MIWLETKFQPDIYSRRTTRCFVPPGNDDCHVASRQIHRRLSVLQLQQTNLRLARPMSRSSKDTTE